MNHERAVSVPSGLIACRIDNTQMRIEEITPCSVNLACDDALPEHIRLELSFYQPESGSYRTVHLNAQQNGQTLGNNAGGSVRFVFNDAACAAEIRHTLQMWSEYVNMRLSDSPESFAEKYLSYPKDTDDYCESIGEQYASWFSRLTFDEALLHGTELAVLIDTPSMWKAYLSLPLPEFLNAYAKMKQLPETFFRAARIRRIYIGSEYCFNLFPDEKQLGEIAEKAASEQLSISFNTPIIHQSQLEQAKRRLHTISSLCPGAEIIVNDWGMLNILQPSRERLIPVFGTLLNRFRRDPRMEWKAAFGEKGELLSENALNDPAFISFLTSLGIRRFEYACGTKMLLPEGSKSLHFPFYPTNVSAYCPLKAYIETGARGKQAEDALCPAYCENNAFLYPKPLRMIHRMRCIMAADQQFPDETYLSGFDRLVFNF